MTSLQNTLRRAAGFLSVILLVAGCASTRPPVTVSVNAAHPGAAIPADFLGLSFEMQRVLAETNGWHFFSPENTNLIAMFQTLGIKNLRVGGNTADRPTLPTPSTADVDALFGFAKAAGVKVIFTLRLNQGSPEAAAQMAKYISNRYAPQLDCFAIGNEPNVFATNYEVYLQEWKRFAAIITAPTNVPAAKFCGPSVSPGHEKWSARFAGDLADSGLLKFISQHDYPGGDARRATNASAARGKLLAVEMDEHYAKFAANFVPEVLSNGLAYRFEEANSFYDGGAAGASDTFASALWALNFQWWWLTHGLAGINFHTGDKVAARDMNKPCRYATFWTAADGYNVHPLGYAEKMFSLGSQGNLLPVKISGVESNLNVAAYAVAGTDGAVYVTLINKTHDASATNLGVQIIARGSNHFGKAAVLRLTAPHGEVAAQTGVTLGGAEISDDAQWAGQWRNFISGSSAPIIDLPAASAALVRLSLE